MVQEGVPLTNKGVPLTNTAALIVVLATVAALGAPLFVVLK